MALLQPGWWHTNYWPESYWHTTPQYWPEWGEPKVGGLEFAPSRREPALLIRPVSGILLTEQRPGELLALLRVLRPDRPIPPAIRAMLTSEQSGATIKAHMQVPRDVETLRELLELFLAEDEQP